MTLFKKGGVDELKRVFPSEASKCADERKVWDSIAREPARVSGTKVAFFSLRRAKNRHPLYKEPSVDDQEWSFHGPYEMYGALEFQQSDEIVPEATETGQHTQADAILWVARAEFEARDAPVPKLGDVFEFWSLDQSAFSEDKRHSQWDVTKANPDGNIFTSETFVQWKIELKQRKKFLAIRKTENTRV